MLSEESLIYLAVQISGRPLALQAAQIGDIITAGLGCAEQLDQLADDAAECGDAPLCAELRACASHFHTACAGFFGPNTPAPTP